MLWDLETGLRVEHSDSNSYMTAVYFQEILLFMLMSLLMTSCSVVPQALNNSGPANDIQPDVEAQMRRPPEGVVRIFSVDAASAWAVVRDGTVLRTDDGGKSWRVPSRNLDNGLVSEIRRNVVDLYFISPEHGWITSFDKTWETKTGGLSWDLAYNERINNIFFTDANAGWMNRGRDGDSANWLTQDGGATWQRCQNSGAGSVPAWLTSSVFFVSSKIGWMTTSRHVDNEFVMTGISKTVDGGCNWNRIWKSTVDPDERFGDLFFIDENTGWFCANDALYNTTDGGRNWKRIDVASGDDGQIEAYFFDSAENGWVLFTGSPETARIVKTSDGGRTWSSATRNLLVDEFRTRIPFPKVPEGLRRVGVVFANLGDRRQGAENMISEFRDRYEKSRFDFCGVHFVICTGNRATVISERGRESLGLPELLFHPDEGEVAGIAIGNVPLIIGLRAFEDHVRRSAPASTRPLRTLPKSRPRLNELPHSYSI